VKGKQGKAQGEWWLRCLFSAIWRLRYSSAQLTFLILFS